MIPKAVTPLLFLNQINNEYSSTFLFKAAIYWSEKGIRVLYISPTRINRLPPGIGELGPQSDLFSQIKFMYLPRPRDLLQHLNSMHRQQVVTPVILVDQFEHYCTLDKDSTQNFEGQVALLCASLLDAANVCAKRCQITSRSHLFVTLFTHNIPKYQFIINNFFSHTTWTITSGKIEVKSEKCTSDKNSESDHILVTEFVSGTHQNSKIQFHFRLESDNKLQLEKILRSVE